MKQTDHYGYYIFLGLGDFGAPTALGPEWTSTWDLSAWKKKIDDLVRLGTNTLFICLMGHNLPYASKKYPECVEKNHPNVKDDFLQAVLDLCVERKIQLVAVFTTTGHAKAYTSIHPETAICDRKGNLQVDRGIMCHHKEDGRKYSLEVIEECLERYHGFTGVILHPPEFGNPCFCQKCQEKYHAACGKSLLSVTDQEAKGFFMASNLLFQRTVIEAQIRRHLPGSRLLTFTIPWIFEAHFEQIAREINLGTAIVDWDYSLSEDRISLLQSRLKRYRQFGHKVWFMPTSGYSGDAPSNASREGINEQQAKMVLRQIELALEIDVADIVYFMGPVWWPAVEQTSYHLHRKRHGG